MKAKKIKFSKTEQNVLNVIDKKLSFQVLHYKNKFGRTKSVDKAIKNLLKKKVIYKDKNNILRRKK